MGNQQKEVLKVDKKTIQKVYDLLMNLRNMRVDGAEWNDILAMTGNLSLSDKSSLSKALTDAGAKLHGKVWDFSDF